MFAIPAPAKVDRDGIVTRAGKVVGQVKKNASFPHRGNGKWMGRASGQASWTYADTKAEAVTFCK